MPCVVQAASGDIVYPTLLAAARAVCALNSYFESFQNALPNTQEPFDLLQLVNRRASVVRVLSHFIDGPRAAAEFFL